MTCNNIYETALALIGEPKHSVSTADYAQRAPALITMSLQRLRALSDRFTGNETSPEALIMTALTNVYPLAPELFEAVCLHVASLLILDELPDVSDALYERAKASEKAAEKAQCTVSKISGGAVL